MMIRFANRFLIVFQFSLYCTWFNVLHTEVNDGLIKSLEQIIFFVGK